MASDSKSRGRLSKAQPTALVTSGGTNLGLANKIAAAAVQTSIPRKLNDRRIALLGPRTSVQLDSTEKRNTPYGTFASWLEATDAVLEHQHWFRRQWAGQRARAVAGAGIMTGYAPARQ